MKIMFNELSASMRKLLTILNDMVRNGTRWQEQKQPEARKEAIAAPSLN